MRPFIFLVLVWLAFRFGALLLSGAGASTGGGHPPSIDRQQVDSVLRTWSKPSREVARRTIADYGLPDGCGDNILWWERGNDARLVLLRDADRDARPAAWRSANQRVARRTF
jgi:hypothetical protein